MQEPEIPANEAERLAALNAQAIMDTEAEDELDRITRLLAETLDTPIALVSLVDDKRQWFKSRVGLDATETPREISFCGHAVASGQPLIVNNALEDERFRDNPLVEGAPDIRFYAGIPLKTASGHILGTLCAIDREPRDLTNEQRFFLESLAGVAERHLNLRHKMLGLQSENDDLERLVAMAVHDLKNPLSGIIGLARLMQAVPPEPADLEEFADLMASGALLLDAMVLNLLDTVTQRNASMKAHIQHECAASLIRSVEKELRVVASEKMQTLSVELDSDSIMAFFDPHLVRRILHNLVMNAFQYTDPGKEVRVTARIDGDALAIFVEDSGKGIPADERESVFEPFKRSTTGGCSRNKGLGLSFCKMAAEAHGGSIAVTESSSGGAKFVVRLPQTAYPLRP